jgi:hypothetical protein
LIQGVPFVHRHRESALRVQGGGGGLYPLVAGVPIQREIAHDREHLDEIVNVWNAFHSATDGLHLTRDILERCNYTFHIEWIHCSVPFVSKVGRENLADGIHGHRCGGLRIDVHHFHENAVVLRYTEAPTVKS